MKCVLDTPFFFNIVNRPYDDQALGRFSGCVVTERKVKQPTGIFGFANWKCPRCRMIESENEKLAFSVHSLAALLVW